MDRSTAFELPVELLERVFSIGWPGRDSGEPMLDAEERLRCQLVCKTWQQALDPRRWPLQWLELKVEACQDGKPAAPPAALWVQRVRPGVRQLRITIGSEGGHLRGRQPLSFDSPAVRAVHSALLALHPADALHALSLSAPFLVLECFVQDLGRFTGLQQLQLWAWRACLNAQGHPSLGFNPNAVLRSSLLRHLPPQLGCLTASGFNAVRLEPVAAAGDEPATCGAAASGSSQAAEVLPGLTRLLINYTKEAALDAPLRSLAELKVHSCGSVSLAGERLWLPQLTSLQLYGPLQEMPLRCAAMPALARLESGTCLAACDSFSALRQLTHLHLFVWPQKLDTLQGMLEDRMALLASVPSVRSLSVDFPPASELLDQQVARALAAAGATQITYLECNNLACLPHLAAWPNLQSLALLHVRPTSVTSEQLALLAAAPGLRRLAFSYHMRLGARDYSRVCSQETDRLKEVYRALPSCAVIEY